MSMMSNGVSPHDWSLGFGLFLVFDAPTGQASRCIFDFGRINGPRASLLLNAVGALTFRVVDAEGNRHEISTRNTGVPQVLIAELDLTGGLPIGEMRLWINGTLEAKDHIAKAFGPTEDNSTVIGASLDGATPGAAFRMAEMVIMHGPVATADMAKLLKYAAQRYSIAGVKHG